MVAMKLLVSLVVVLVTVAKGDNGVTMEEMARVLNGFMHDVTNQLRTMEVTMSTLAAKVDMLQSEITSIKDSQWRIQDSPEVGVPTLQGWQHTIFPKLPENGRIWTAGGGGGGVV